jgi:RNA polymerase sigma factor (sigma-70 family)
MMTQCNQPDPESATASFAGEEGRALAVEARRSKTADERLATALRRQPPERSEVTRGYLERLGRSPVLAREVERRLVARAQEGDPAARAQLVEAFMPLVASVARQYRDAPYIERMELLQEGVVGLLRALERYDPDRGTPLWPYATWWVRQAMQQLVSELTRPAVLSDAALRQLARVREAHRRAVHETGSEPTRAQLLERTGLSSRQLADLLAVDEVPRSIDEPIGEGGAIGTLGDLLTDPLADDAYQQVLEAIQVQELLALLAGLSDREREVLRGRYGLGGSDEESLRSIGRRLGVSAERVRQIERRALGKLAAGMHAHEG